VCVCVCVCVCVYERERERYKTIITSRRGFEVVIISSYKVALVGFTVIQGENYNSFAIAICIVQRANSAQQSLTTACSRVREKRKLRVLKN